MFGLIQTALKLLREIVAPLSAVIGFGLVAIAFLNSLQNSLAAGS